MELFDITVIGGGPSGLFALFYAGMRGAKAKVIDVLPELGGQLYALYPEKYIYDMPGFPAIIAQDLVKGCVDQAFQWPHARCLEERVIDIENGSVVSADGNLNTPVEKLVEVLEDAQILGKGARGPNPTGMSVLTFGIQVVEVAVDVETGEVRVDRVYAAHDVGRIVNTLGARSQVEGGIIQGIGHTLSEVRLHDPETGRILTTTLDAYRMPTIADVPEIVSEFVDKPDAHLTNLGSKGLGEPPIVPTAAAIANAIRDATGADVHELPISREEMLRALKEARERERRGAPAAV